ncbi:MAG TPA: hypothetical protein VLU43_03305 [Anaeromyxobacteraceae bacterium]|nr:hypothetical protein [Anaeromyxobacteraceae bacterium]
MALRLAHRIVAAALLAALATAWAAPAAARCGSPGARAMPCCHRAKAPAAPSVERASCCSVREAPAPAPAGAATVRAPAAAQLADGAPVAWLAAVAPPAPPRADAFDHAPPPGAGPIHLRIRSLLI